MNLRKNSAITWLASSSIWIVVFLFAAVACCSKHDTRSANPSANKQSSEAPHNDQSPQAEDVSEPDAASTPESQNDAAAVNAGKTQAGIARQLDEANKSFTYRGKPINPRAVNELCVCESNPGVGPIAKPIAVDLNDTDTDELKKEKDGRYEIDFNSISPKPENEERGYFIYKRLGTLKNGIHVLEIWDNGGGQFVGVSLLLIKFGIDYEYEEGGSRRYRLIMQRIGDIALGDRWEGRITIGARENTIRIGRGEYAGGKTPAEVIAIK